MEDYRTIRGTAIGEYEEKKSRFIAQLSFADSEEKAVAFLEQVRAANRTARHNVYAYRLREGSRERYSDDGEPAKTAGTPALEVLQHSGLTDLIVVITRYFGGVLLGTGGLVRAYTTATSRALEAAEVVTVRSVVALDVTVDYGLYERADLLIKAAGGKLAEPEFTDKVTLRWQMPEHTEGPLLTQLQELTRGTANVTVSEPFYAAFLKSALAGRTSTSLLSADQLPLQPRRSHWQAGPLPTGRPRSDMAQKGGPCYRGQQLLDNAPCQAAAALDCGALQPTKRINFARSVGT